MTTTKGWIQAVAIGIAAVIIVRLPLDYYGAPWAVSFGLGFIGAVAAGIIARRLGLIEERAP